MMDMQWCADSDVECDVECDVETDIVETDNHSVSTGKKGFSKLSKTVIIYKTDYV